ncbi:MAG: helix-turn-helix transcriptional regulator [Clostridia bacterium]|nr:helix-turn-helix transcriptional regulator [Clostridia bacterium]
MGKKVGKLIKAARTGADMTQEQLARRISGVSANDISLAERGEKDLTQAQLKKIATITGVTQASLIDAAKAENGTAKKTTTKKTTTARKTTTPKTPASANSTMKVTSTERKLVEAYRLADSDTKKRAMNLLKGKDEGVLGSLLGGADISDKVEDVIGDVLGGLLGNK